MAGEQILIGNLWTTRSVIKILFVMSFGHRLKGSQGIRRDLCGGCRVTGSPTAINLVFDTTN